MHLSLNIYNFTAGTMAAPERRIGRGFLPTAPDEDLRFLVLPIPPSRPIITPAETVSQDVGASTCVVAARECGYTSADCHINPTDTTETVSKMPHNVLSLLIIAFQNHREKVIQLFMFRYNDVDEEAKRVACRVKNRNVTDADLANVSASMAETMALELQFILIMTLCLSCRQSGAGSSKLSTMLMKIFS